MHNAVHFVVFLVTKYTYLLTFITVKFHSLICPLEMDLVPGCCTPIYMHLCSMHMPKILIN